VIYYLFYGRAPKFDTALLLIPFHASLLKYNFLIDVNWVFTQAFQAEVRKVIFREQTGEGVGEM
jgi:hypothetical protein